MKNTLLHTANSVLLLLLLIMVWKVYVKLPDSSATTHQSEAVASSSSSRESSQIGFTEDNEQLHSDENVALSTVRELIGSEIRKQLASSLHELAQAEPAALDVIKSPNKVDVALTEEEQFRYKHAEQLLDNVANGTTWTQDVDLQFESILAQLPAQESFELVRMQAKLVSQGLIEIPLDVVGANPQ